MNLRQLAVGTAIALASMAASAQASGEFLAFKDVMSMKMIDKNKDGMVSKKEYLDMAAKAWDMNAKKMGVKGDNMTEEQFKQFMNYIGEKF